jgi:hypothetical protein
VPALKHAHGGEKANAGAERRPTDLQFAREFALRRKAIAGAECSAGDEAAYMVYDLEGKLTVAAWFFACLLFCAPWHCVVPSFNAAAGCSNDS